MSDTIKLNDCPKCGIPIPAEAPQGLCPKCVLLNAATATEADVPPTATSEVPTLERVAAAFPQLEILELVGRGGMGFVFKACQPHLDRCVALKLLPDRLARDPRFAERFNREGRVLARLSHPNIVSVYDFGKTEHFYFLLMEFVDGVNLRQAMQAGRFSPGEALAIVPKICEALQYAHEQGILHRDIKPENILLDAHGRVKIADFGIAKLVGGEKPGVSLTATGAAIGTPHYMAPEQLEKPTDVDHRADIYSLGVVFYEMLTGELPIGRFAAPSSKTPVGANVDAVVFRTLEKDRERRYQSAGEMKTQVEHAASEPPPIQPAQPKFAPASPPRWVRPVAILFVVLGALALPPSLFSLGSSRFVFHWFALLALTGIALLTRNQIWRRAALAANVIGLLLPWLSAFTVATARQNGTLSPDWSPTLLGIPNSAGLAVLFGLLETSVFALASWVLLLGEVKALFEAARPEPLRRQGLEPSADISPFSAKAIWGATLVALSLLVPVFFPAFVLPRTRAMQAWEFFPVPFSSFLLPVLASCALPALAGTILGWVALSDIGARRGQLRGAVLAVFAALTWPVLVLAGVAVWFVVRAAGNFGATHAFAGFLLLLVPVEMITFLIRTR